MFLRFTNGTLVYFDSTADNGVQVYSWEYFVHANIQKYYKQISFRKLRMDRSRETLVKLEEFVKKVRGLEYSLDVEKLIRKTFNFF